MYGNEKKKKSNKSASPLTIIAATSTAVPKDNTRVKRVKPNLSMKKTVTDMPKKKYTKTVKKIKY
jgi:hypothetical protein